MCGITPQASASNNNIDIKEKVIKFKKHLIKILSPSKTPKNKNCESPLSLSKSQKLKKCTKGHRCNDFLCPVCNYHINKSFVKRVLKEFSKYNDGNLYFATIIDEFNVTKYKPFRYYTKELYSNFRNLFKDSDVQALGVLDISSNKEELVGIFDTEVLDYFQVHFHLIIKSSQYNETDLEKIIKSKYSKAVSDRPVDVQAIKQTTNDLSTVANYCFKLWYYKHFISKRLSDSQYRKLASTFDEKATDKLFSYNCGKALMKCRNKIKQLNSHFHHK